MVVIIKHKHHLKFGGLHGWCIYCPEEARRKSIMAAVRVDGKKTVEHRLIYLLVVLKHNKQVNKIRSDLAWLRRQDV